MAAFNDEPSVTFIREAYGWQRPLGGGPGFYITSGPRDATIHAGPFKSFDEAEKALRLGVYRVG